MPAKQKSPETLESVVAALPAKEARARLLDLLRKYPEHGRELLREKCDFREDEDDNAYLDSLRSSLEAIIDELAASIESDEFTPYWEEDKLTDELSYTSQMGDLFEEAAAKMPLDVLIDLAFEFDDMLADQTVFDWHPDPTEGLRDFFEGIGVGMIKATPKKEQAAVLGSLETSFEKALSDSCIDTEWLMKTIRRKTGLSQD